MTDHVSEMIVVPQSEQIRRESDNRPSLPSDILNKQVYEHRKSTRPNGLPNVVKKF